MFHLAANYGSLAGAANTQVNALDDTILSIRSSLHVPGENLNCVALLPIGALLLRGRIANPSIASIANAYMIPLNPTAAVVRNQKVMDLRGRPMLYRANEGIIYQVTNSGAGPTDTSVISFLEQSRTPAPSGQIYNLRGTSTTASVAWTWTSIGTPTWEQQLPQGTYAVVGGAYYGTTAIAFQVIFDGQFYRPGGLGMATESDMPWEGQLWGGMGLWGIFGVQSYPRIMVLNGGAVSAHNIYLNCVKIG